MRLVIFLWFCFGLEVFCHPIDTGQRTSSLHRNRIRDLSWVTPVATFLTGALSGAAFKDPIVDKLKRLRPPLTKGQYRRKMRQDWKRIEKQRVREKGGTEKPPPRELTDRWHSYDPKTAQQYGGYLDDDQKDERGFERGEWGNRPMYMESLEPSSDQNLVGRQKQENNLLGDVKQALQQVPGELSERFNPQVHGRPGGLGAPGSILKIRPRLK